MPENLSTPQKSIKQLEKEKREQIQNKNIQQKLPI